MANVIPFTFESNAVRVVADEQGEPLFVAKDVLRALGYTDVSNIPKAIAAVPDEWKGREPIPTPGGTQDMRVLSEPGLYFFLARSDKPAALPFQKWLAGEVLPTIRKTGGYTIERKSDLETLVPVSREMRAAVSIAKAIGFKGNQAVLSANKAVQRVTGIDVLEEFEATHLVADSQAALFTVTEIGQRAGISPRRVNPVLEEIGLVRGYRDHKDRQCWELAPRGEQAGGVYLDTGKRHSDGTPVRQIKWTGNVVSMLTGRANAADRARPALEAP